MTEDQKELRVERIAIMTVEGVSKEYAEKFCDSMPWLYGSEERKEVQNELFKSGARQTMP